MTLDELIAALEKAEGPCRELDSYVGSFCEWHGDPDSFGQLPWFTSSIDAALTLLPEGAAIEAMSVWPATTATGSYVTAIGTHQRKDGTRWHSSKDGRWRASHAHPAIALCIAALKARKP